MYARQQLEHAKSKSATFFVDNTGAEQSDKHVAGYQVNNSMSVRLRLAYSTRWYLASFSSIVFLRSIHVANVSLHRYVLPRECDR
jgi:hypothetical protein